MSRPDKAEAHRHFEAASLPAVIWGPRKRRAEVTLEKIETEGEKQLKDQVKKQLETNVTLSSELGKKKNFASASVFDPVQVRGELSLDKYQRFTEEATRLEQLRSYRLTENEIQIKLAQEKEQLQKPPGYGSDPLTEEATLAAIDKKIATYEETLPTSSFTGGKQLTRHEMDLEKALTQNQDHDKSKLLGILVSEKQLDVCEDEKTANPLKEMLKGIEERIQGSDDIEARENSSSESSSNESENETPIAEGSVLYKSTGCEACDELRKKNRYFVGPLLKNEYCYYEQCDPCKQLKNKAYNERVIKEHRTKTLMVGCKNEGELINRKKKAKKKKKKNRKTAPLKLDQGKECVEGLKFSEEVDSIVESVPIEAIVEYRLSAAQIKAIPRFANYCPGEPHHTLYVKNLSEKVTETDLKSLVCQFNTSGPIHYRLLAGRMRGQAFITFSDVSTATKALELLHGYEFKGKPMIIQYGKKQPSLQ